MYRFDQMYLAIRPAHLQLDGKIYYVDPNSPIIYSNHFIEGRSKSNPTKYYHDVDIKLKIDNIRTAIIPSSLNHNIS
ncbi:unnamed protein product [Rotaria sp. Silwood1]|nr:unnamed protein product [Rotaria sp. Silwood1]